MPQICCYVTGVGTPVYPMYMPYMPHLTGTTMERMIGHYTVHHTSTQYNTQYYTYQKLNLGMCQH